MVGNLVLLALTFTDMLLGDVILTYSHSKLVEKVLLDAAAQGKKIKVIVADGRVQNLGNIIIT